MSDLSGKIARHIIDCDADPYLPNAWEGVHSHRKGGHVEWNPENFRIYIPSLQQDGKRIRIHDFCDQCKDQPLANANVLDWLLANQELIPDAWIKSQPCFLGTVYLDRDGYRCVRSLYFYMVARRWCWCTYWLYDGLSCQAPVLFVGNQLVLEAKILYLESL